MKIVQSIVGRDKTKKYFFYPDEKKDEHVEACLLNLPKHGYVICVSSQIGCIQKCAFCAVGSKPFKRNLSAQEIQGQVDQILEDNLDVRNTKFQVTYMGSGEPFENWEEVFTSIQNLRKTYRNLEKINISTIWPEAATKKCRDIDWALYKDFLHFQYSLHFSDDLIRKKYFRTCLPSGLEVIKQLNGISDLINDRYRINYVLFDGINDTELQVEQLETLMSYTRNAVLKISQMCDVKGCELKPSKNFDTFVEKIEKAVSLVEVFKSDGMDINAGCGQFYNDSIV